MESKPPVEQQFRCKTQNCSKSFKNASSLFRHNKCCIRFGKDYPEPPRAEENIFIPKYPESEPKTEAFSSSTDNGTRDATCLCEPGDEKTAAYVTATVLAADNGGAAGVDLAAGEEPATKKNKKQVILNPDGELAASERYNHEDLVIDEAQAAKLESYSCYAGVPQRDKAGQFFVWVNGLADSRAELQCVSRHARLYSQLLGRISSATKKMDSKIVSLANSILEKGHPKNSFNFKGLVQWSFIEKLYTTKSTEAKKLIQSFSGSASNRMRVIVGLCNASRVGKMRHRYFKVARPSWVSQLKICLKSALLNDFGGERSIRRQFYDQVDAWDGKVVTDELVESMPFLRLLYLFHELGYFKASQVNRAPIEGGGDSVKWMSYFDEIEALCAVQAAFSDDFSFVMSELAESESSAAFDPLSASVPALDPIDFSCPEPLSFSAAGADHSGAEDSEAKRSSNAKKNMESCWSVHVRAMCKACGASVKIDKDRVCSDAWSTSETQEELSEADKILAAKIIRLRNHAFLLWQVFDTPADRRIFTPFHVEHVLAVPITAPLTSAAAGTVPVASNSNSSCADPAEAGAGVGSSSSPPKGTSSSSSSRESETDALKEIKRGVEEKGPEPPKKKSRDSKAQLRRQIRDEDDITFY